MNFLELTERESGLAENTPDWILRLAKVRVNEIKPQKVRIFPNLSSPIYSFAKMYLQPHKKG